MAELAPAATGAPVVDRLDTRALERRAVLRGHVHHADILERTDTTLLLRTWDRVNTKLTAWGDVPPRDPGVELTPGTLRIDAVGADVYRVRYARGEELPPDRPTAMIVGSLDGQGSLADVHVDLRPLSIRIGDAFRAGGREKNEWGLWDTYNTGICRTVADDRPLAVECFALRPGEAGFGFGEKFLRLDTVGQTVDLNMVEATGTTTPRSYKNIPFFWTTRGYGVFLHSSARISCWVGSRGAADIQVAVEDDRLDYFVFLGEPKTILDRYTTLTGKARVPPRWSFGWWQSKISYRSADEVLDVVRRYRAAELPVDVVHLDTHWFREDWRNDLEFDAERFPDPKSMHDELRDLGAHTSLWQLPYIPEGSALYDELDAAGAFVRTADGTETYDVAICYTRGFTGKVGCIDFTNPAAVEIYGRHIRRLHDLGAGAIKVDFGEQAPLDATYHDGTPGRLAHNLYPLLYNQAIAEATHEATGEWVIWARSAWAGSQRYPLHWGGDSSANWDNLGPQLAGGLSLGLSGFSFWSQDIGGFLTPTGGDLLVRWIQAGVLLSHARIHGVGTRELDRFGDDVLDLAREAINLRYRLLPYVIGESHRSAAAGLPVARALVVEFPDDPTTYHVDDQWLLGEHLLVAPILDETGRRRVYLPAGRWADWWDGTVVSGPGWIDVEVPIDRIPLWIRDGGVIPLGPVLQHVGERPTDALLLRALPPVGRATSGLVDVDGRLVPWRWDQDGVRIDVGDVAVEWDEL